MTIMTEKQIAEVKAQITGLGITEFYYEEDGDYFVISLDDGTEISFRFMVDLEG
jgi:hypothetical protein